jgi:hypothetical protein
VVVSDFLPAAIGLLVDRDGESPHDAADQVTGAADRQDVQGAEGREFGAAEACGAVCG